MMEEVKPPEAILVNKNVFIACMRALAVYLDSKSENFETFRTSQAISSDTRQLLLNLLKHDLQAIGQITNALESSMDFTIDPDDSKGFIN